MRGERLSVSRGGRSVGGRGRKFFFWARRNGLVWSISESKRRFGMGMPKRSLGTRVWGTSEALVVRRGRLEACPRLGQRRNEFVERGVISRRLGVVVAAVFDGEEALDWAGDGVEEAVAEDEGDERVRS